MIVSGILLVAGCGATDDASATGAGAPDESAEPGEVGSVFPLPPGSISELEAYAVSDDGQTRTETVSVLVAGATLDSVVGYYQAILGNMGYVLGDPTPIGGARRIEINDPADATITAVIEVDDQEGGIGISQTRTRQLTS